ncbi:hypothetical protein PI124_g450 [Phytophthora idaei]|nr:hypothetical protein PI124_g450 [Phytophthora idaei]
MKVENLSGRVLRRCTMDDIESLVPAYHEGFEGNNSSAQTPTGFPQSMEGIEDEVRSYQDFYLRALDRLTLTDDMWVVDAEP